MKADIIFQNIRKLYTPTQKAPIHGEWMKKIKVFENVNVVIKDGLILNVGLFNCAPYIDEHTIVIDCANEIMLPGFIDSHTHLVHYGSREKEALMLLEGKSYLDILKEGGGILSTVKETRNASFDELTKKGKKVLSRMLSFGVTSLEAKSGYGLDFDTEIKQLEVANHLNDLQPIEIYSTYLGAHALPKEYQSNRNDYISLMKTNMVYIKEHQLAKAIDVFMEDGVFNKEETKELFEYAKTLGFDLHLHADEMISLGGAGLGISMQASSVDHLMAISEEDLSMIKNTDTICNVLPTTSFFLNKEYANARKMIDHGGALSISSDYNPGSAPSENFQFALQLAFQKMKLHPYEIITAATINPAYSLNIHNRVGSIEIGKQADLILFDTDNFESVLLDFGTNHISRVVKKGQLVVNSKE